MEAETMVSAPVQPAVPAPVLASAAPGQAGPNGSPATAGDQNASLLLDTRRWIALSMLQQWQVSQAQLQQQQLQGQWLHQQRLAHTMGDLARYVPAPANGLSESPVPQPAVAAETGAGGSPVPAPHHDAQLPIASGREQQLAVDGPSVAPEAPLVMASGRDHGAALHTQAPGAGADRASERGEDLAVQ